MPVIEIHTAVELNSCDHSTPPINSEKARIDKKRINAVKPTHNKAKNKNTKTPPIAISVMI